MLRVKVRAGFVCWMSFDPIRYYLDGEEFDCTVEEYWAHAHQLEIITGDPNALAAIAAIDETAVAATITASKTTTSKSAAA